VLLLAAAVHATLYGSRRSGPGPRRWAWLVVYITVYVVAAWALTGAQPWWFLGLVLGPAVVSTVSVIVAVATFGWWALNGHISKLAAMRTLLDALLVGAADRRGATDTDADGGAEAARDASTPPRTPSIPV
jgi:hypothetical protein